MYENTFQKGKSLKYQAFHFQFSKNYRTDRNEMYNNTKTRGERELKWFKIKPDQKYLYDVSEVFLILF